MPLLDLLLLAGMSVANIMLYVDEDVVVPPGLDQVVAVSFHREWWRDESDCRFYGVAVPFSRTWEEHYQHGDVETTSAPEPDTRAGIALVINRKICPGKADEAIFRTSDIWHGRVTNIYRKSQHYSIEVASLREDLRPKWLPQVMERIEKSSSTNLAAKNFLEFAAKVKSGAPQAAMSAETSAQ